MVFRNFIRGRANIEIILYDLENLSNVNRKIREKLHIILIIAFTYIITFIPLYFIILFYNTTRESHLRYHVIYYRIMFFFYYLMPFLIVRFDNFATQAVERIFRKGVTFSERASELFSLSINLRQRFRVRG